MIWLTRILGWVAGGGLNGLANRLGDAYEARLQAKTKEQVLEAEHNMRRLENAMHAAQIANEDRWSATSIGRYLIVVPYGIWWGLTWLDSAFAFSWDTLEPPLYLLATAEWLVPAIVVGDVGKSAVRVFDKRLNIRYPAPTQPKSTQRRDR